MKRLASAILAVALVAALIPSDAGARRYDRHDRGRHRPHFGLPVPSPGEALLGLMILGAILDRPERPVPPHYGRIDTDVQPEEANVYIDGQFVGTADDLDGYPNYLYLPAGRHRVTFELEGYRGWSRVVQVRPGRELALHFNLQRLRPGEPDDWDLGPAEPPVDEPGYGPQGEPERRPDPRDGPLGWETN